MKKIFITGTGGCVGHYLFDALSNDRNYQLYLFVRNPQKLRFDPKGAVIIKDDLMNIKKHADLLKQMDGVVHLAADWGSGIGNYEQSLDFFNLLDPDRCQKVIYFSTASILGPDGRPAAAAEKLGTPYIRSKYRFYKKLPELKIYPRVTTLFPTWVLGGDKTHPYSHASQGIRDLKKWLWLIRFFTVDATFHFIHAQDMALITKHLLEKEAKEKEYVLGNAPITVSEFIREVCRFMKTRVYFQVPIPLQLVQLLAFLTGRKLHAWDLYCFTHRHFVYQTVNAESFGIKSSRSTVEQILMD